MTMRITKVTPIISKADPENGVEVFVGEFREVENEWYQADIASLEALLEREGVAYREYHLMRKAIGFESGLLVGLLIWGAAEVLKVLAAWLPAREGRKVRIKFKDGTEIEATTVKELEQIRDKFLPEKSETSTGE
jgi:hypothetical protein